MWLTYQYAECSCDIFLCEKFRRRFCESWDSHSCVSDYGFTFRNITVPYRSSSLHGICWFVGVFKRSADSYKSSAAQHWQLYWSKSWEICTSSALDMGELGPRKMLVSVQCRVPVSLTWLFSENMTKYKNKTINLSLPTRLYYINMTDSMISTNSNKNWNVTGKQKECFIMDWLRTQLWRM
jgi:hypothetical protein